MVRMRSKVMRMRRIPPDAWADWLVAHRSRAHLSKSSVFTQLTLSLLFVQVYSRGEVSF